MRPVKLRKGDRLWVKDKDLVWREAVLLGRAKDEHDPDRLLVQLGTNGEEDARSVKTATNKKKYPTKTVSARTDCEVRLVASTAELESVEDLTQVPALHEPSLLATLHARFDANQIYTRSGRVLLALNPYKPIKGLYGRTIINQYYRAGAATEGLPPHLYGVASTAYVNALDEGGTNQTVLVSGESGSGKTESTKILLRAITEMTELRLGSKNKPRGRAGRPALSDRVLQANPILEAFGNASTLRNENSSRFGKLIQVALRPVQGTLDGGCITTYLLEKARLAHQSPGERNFHVFYAMYAGGSRDELQAWRLQETGRGLEAFAYISDSEAILEDVDADSKRLEAVKNAMKVLGFSSSEVKAVFEVVAGVLHLGNIEFAAGNHGEASSVAPKGASMLSCAACCDLLQIDANALERALCKRVIRVNGSRKAHALPSFAHRQDESFEKPNSVEDAARARDALAMTLYERLFAWLVWRVNQSLRDVHNLTDPPTSTDSNATTSTTASTAILSPASAADAGPALHRGFEIGILDVFGFEVFAQNGFEQLCINYCNERLQSLFNEYVFLRDQREYNAEGINWEYVNFPENNTCLEMIESRPIGLLALMDENCLVPHGNDESLINKIYAHLPKQYEQYLPASQYDRGNMRFTVRHFAGQVLYSAAGFTRKNKNELRQEAVDLLRSSRHRIVCILCPQDAADAAGGADLASYFDEQLGAKASPGKGAVPGRPAANGILRNRHGPVASALSRGAVQQKTVMAHFKAQLDAALQTIRASETHFVRCLKPNDEDEPGYLDRPRLVEQLRYSGVLQMVQVARGGYLTRMVYEDFLMRFCTLLPLLGPSVRAGRYFGTPSRALALSRGASRTKLQGYCKDILRCFGLVYGADFQTGKTKVFLRQHSFTLLEMAKDAAHGRAARVIQRVFRVHVEHQLQREAATMIQCMVRQSAARHLRRVMSERREEAAQTIQLAVLQYLNRMRRYRRRQARHERAKQQKKAKSLGLVCSPVATRVTFNLAKLEVREIESRHDEEPYTAPSIIIPDYNEDLAWDDEGEIGNGESRARNRKLESPPPPPQQLDDLRDSTQSRDSGRDPLEAEPFLEDEAFSSAAQSDILQTSSKVKKPKKRLVSPPPPLQRDGDEEDDDNEFTTKNQGSHDSPEPAKKSSKKKNKKTDGRGVEANDVGFTTSAKKDSNNKKEPQESDEMMMKRVFREHGFEDERKLLDKAGFSSVEALHRVKHADLRSIGISQFAILTASAMFVVLIPLAFALGGLDSGLSYATAAVMTAWIWFHVFVRGSGDSDDDDDELDDNDDDDDDENASVSSSASDTDSAGPSSSTAKPRAKSTKKGEKSSAAPAASAKNKDKSKNTDKKKDKTKDKEKKKAKSKSEKT
ncbi:Myosin-6 [Hondaea fermentalgiana]|uniref:Myosin-6 n=1 Tax=Hondaea fermentalgiana TaxID=2315210 RepID=A0A2R5GPQ6_9STRA|nr:Myosin-6 [Hondaea fermentalgiana]|eukprot:GBG30603.1 Myosin-6 [Hondaea fermentalgiana]